MTVPSEDFRGLSIFVEAVEAEGFAAAATRLNLSRSAVSKTVARLERTLGVRLFHRTTRALSLTEDGQAFYEHCLRALTEIRNGVAALDHGRREVAGRLRITAPVLFGRHCVSPLLVDLARRHPRLELELGFSDRLSDPVEDGFDLAIRSGPLDQWPGLMVRRIARQSMLLCASPDYLAARGEPRRPDDIPDHDGIVYGRAGRVKGWGFPTPDAPDREFHPRARLRFDDLEAIADAATAGMGLAWLPCWLVRERVATGELKPLLPGAPTTVFPIHAVWPQSPHLPLRIRAAIDMLAANLPAMTGL